MADKDDRDDGGMRRREVLRALGGAALGGVSVLGASSALGQTGVGAEATSLAVTAKSSLQGLTIKPVGPVEIKLVAKNPGTRPANVAWRIDVDGRPLKSGIQEKVLGGASFTVAAAWTATPGVHQLTGIVDPDDKRTALAVERQSNRQQISAEFDPWVTWGDAMYEAVAYAVHLWQLQAHFQNIQIMAVSAIGTPGCLAGPSLEPLIKSAPGVAAAAGPFARVRDGFAKAVSDKWKAWQDQVTVPGLAWYPAFAAFPGPMAPPMPNVPMPLVACTSSKMTELSDPSRLEAALAAALAAEATTANAKQVIHAFAQALSLRFLKWLPANTVQLVLGKGPIPTFAPPYVPVGPVVGGDVIPTPGHLNTTQF
jgi:hypothetical protein